LSALEVQLVRVNPVQRFPLETEIGLTPRKLTGDLILKIERKDGKKVKEITNLNSKIQTGDVLYSLSTTIAKDYHELNELGLLAKELDVELSLHTPYYMDMITDDEIRDKSIQGIRWGGLIASELDATVIVTHLGLYGDYNTEAASKRVESSIKTVRSLFKRSGIEIPLGLETTGRQEVFGEVDEVLTLCKKLDGVKPILNFAHLHSRSGGSLKKKEDFEEAFAKVKRFGKKIHCHFAGVEHAGGNELRYTPIKKGDLRFEPLIELILENDFEVTLISGSPLLEHDAMYMKVIMERVIMRKMLKPKRKKGGKSAR
ncbi:MAG: TIM barrel protein, partial [Thermoplasmata archaeon]|nr:TIM barrel protein [Thermoplasmata archaeon]